MFYPYVSIIFRPMSLKYRACQATWSPCTKYVAKSRMRTVSQNENFEIFKKKIAQVHQTLGPPRKKTAETNLLYRPTPANFWAKCSIKCGACHAKRRYHKMSWKSHERTRHAGENTPSQRSLGTCCVESRGTFVQGPPNSQDQETTRPEPL